MPTFASILWRQLEKLAGVFFLVSGLLTVASTYEFFVLGTVTTELAPPRPAVLALPASETRVAVLRSDYSARFLASGEAYSLHADYWIQLLGSLGIEHEIISDQQLEGDLTPYHTVVLPAAICLSNKQKNNIRDFLRDGKGVLATWATGTRDERGAWKGWEFLIELTGAVSFEIKDRPPPWYVSFYAGTPLSAGAPAAARVQLASPERVEATSLSVGAYWSDFSLFPVDPALPETHLGAALHHQRGGGRVVWFGFLENSVVGGGPDKAILDAALANAIHWTSQGVVLEVTSWPAPYSSAVVFSLNVENRSENARYAAQRLLRGHAPGTCYFSGE